MASNNDNNNNTSNSDENENNNTANTTIVVDEEVYGQSATSRAVEAFLQTDYTFDDAIEFSQKLQSESYARQEEIFNRVFLALQSEGAIGKGETNLADMPPDILSAWNERKQKNAKETQRKLRLKMENEERIVLEAQRERLLRRFDPDSEDSQGIDPFATSNDNSSSSSSSSISGVADNKNAGNAWIIVLIKYFVCPNHIYYIIILFIIQVVIIIMLMLKRCYLMKNMLALKINI